jgi:hypothetical protein
VCGALDGDRITAAGQVFRMEMHHDGHPEKDDEIANLVEVLEEPTPTPGSRRSSPATSTARSGTWPLPTTGASSTRPATSTWRAAAAAAV